MKAATIEPMWIMGPYLPAQSENPQGTLVKQYAHMYTHIVHRTIFILPYVCSGWLNLKDGVKVVVGFPMPFCLIALAHPTADQRTRRRLCRASWR
jgi:hypothetical protein